MASNITVTIRLRDKVSAQMNKVGASAQKTESKFNRMGGSITRVMAKMKSDLSKAASGGEKLKRINLSPLRKQFVDISRTVQGLNRNTNALTQTVSRLAATYLGVMGAKGAISVSDTFTSAKNKLSDTLSAEFDSDEVNNALEKMYTSAQKTRANYGEFMNQTSKMYILATDSFGNNIDNAIRFYEIMSEAYAIGGATQNEQMQSMGQLIQSLGSGIMQGEELKSVRENAPLAYKEIEKFAQKVLNTTDSLKDLGAEGLVTSDMIVQAINQAGSTFDERFKNTKPTFEQMWNTFKNDAMMAFKPVSEKLNEIARSESFQTIVGKAVGALQVMAKVLYFVLSGVQIAIDWIADHWSIVAPIVLFFLGLIITSFAILALKGLWAFLSIGLGVASAIAQMAILIAQEILYGVVSLAASMMATFGFQGTILIIMLVILAVIALISVFNYFGISVGDVFDFIVGIIFTAFAYIINKGIYMINNLIIAFEFLANVVQNPMYSIQRLFGNIIINMIDFALSFGDKFFSVIDAIAGKFAEFFNWVVSGYNKLADKVGLDTVSTIDTNFNSKATLNDVRANIESSLEKNKPKDYKTYDRLNYINLDKAFNTGKNLRKNTTEKVKKIAKGVKDKYNQYDKKQSTKYDKVGKNMNGLNDSVGSTPTDNAGKGSSKVGNIDKNTKKIADNTSKLDEDFSYLIELAERDTINRFTTATIKVEMNNTNQIKERADVDGIINTLSSRLKEELDVVAAGTHY